MEIFLPCTFVNCKDADGLLTPMPTLPVVPITILAPAPAL